MSKPKVLNYGEEDTAFEQIIRSHLPQINSYDVVQIIHRYNEPWRRYHNQNHILTVLSLADEVIPANVLTDEEWNLLRAMIIFHDVEYKLNREIGWNENESAAFARVCLEREGAPEEFIRSVEIGVRATITHTLTNVPENLHEVVSFLIDSDLLAGLGSTLEQFQWNTANICMEYEPLYTIGEYHQGRKKWAEGMLARDKIYLSDWFSHHEAAARENLTLVVEGTP